MPIFYCAIAKDKKIVSEYATTKGNFHDIVQQLLSVFLLSSFPLSPFPFPLSPFPPSSILVLIVMLICVIGRSKYKRENDISIRRVCFSPF